MILQLGNNILILRAQILEFHERLIDYNLEDVNSDNHPTLSSPRQQKVIVRTVNERTNI